MNIVETDGKYVAKTYARFPLVLTHGNGAYVYDENEKEYIDLGAGIAVNTFGYADSEWADAVSAQLHTLQHTSNLYYTEPCARLAQMLCERTGMSRVFFGNSGAEANECAIKAARRYSFLRYGEGHSTIITLKNSFHGRTVTTLSATGQEHYHTDFFPFTEGFVYADASKPETLEKLACENSCCAVMIETIQGEGGVIPLSDEFINAVKAVCSKHGLLLIVDEVQTGNGRTGKLYSYMHWDLSPDIVTTAKGLGNGLPIGAVMFAETTADVLTPGTHGSTFGGNPAVCAGALNVLGRLDGRLLSETAEKGEYIKKALSGKKGVVSVSGKGLMLGIEITGSAGEVIAACREKGVLLLSAKDRLRLLPPLCITYEQIDTALGVIADCL